MSSRSSFVVGVLLSLGSAAYGQGHQLAETAKAGDCFRHAIEMKLSGEMRFVESDAKAVKVKLNATATHALCERALVVENGQVKKSARAYETAKAAIQRGNDKSENGLRPSRRLVVAQRDKNGPLAYSPAGAMTRGELELVGEHFDTLAVAGLLPGKEVKVGETWKPGDAAAQAALGMEGMTKHDLVGKLDKVEGDVATLSFAGKASGVWQGAKLEASVEATGSFDLKRKRLTRLAWKQKDDRDQGPVSPASSIEVEVTLARSPIERPASLDDVALVSLPEGFDPPGPMTNVEHRDAKGRYALVHPRDWHLTAAGADHAVLRLMDKGLWVAQVTVTPWTTAKKGEHLSPQQFEQAMNGTSGWRPERVLQSGEIPSEGGRWTYRLSQVGQLNGVTVMQNFYLVAAPSGEQVVLTFTLSPKMAEKLGARDLTVAASVEVPAKE